MRTHRRLTKAALAGTLVAVAGLALAGCRTDPAVAAYVGDTVFTEQRVSDLVAAGGQGVSREIVVETLVLGQTCRNFAAEKNFQPNTQAGQQGVAQERIDPDTAFGQERAAMWGCIYATPQSTEKASDEDLRYVYDRLEAAGALKEGATFDLVKPQLAGDEQVSGSLAFRRLWLDAAAGQDISVNPRYRALSYPILSNSGTVLIELTLGQPANTAVKDAPAPAPTTTAAAS
ncbi:MAG: hypothetical protein HOV79_10765 [Hamadaea sp.]|nr:hypothetical protein [Hamadaea sp.]